MDQQRICFLMELYHPVVGGAESHARLLAHQFSQSNALVSVVTRRRKSSYLPIERIDQSSVYRVWPWGFPRFGKYLMMIPAFLKLLRLKNNYDLIYVCGFRILGVVGVFAGKLLNKKVVLRAESCGELSGGFVYANSEKQDQPITSFPIRIYLTIRNAILNRADGFIAISDAIKEEFLASGIQQKKIRLIPNGIDTDHFSPVDKQKKSSIRQALNLPADTTIFSYSGKLNRGKGLEFLLRVWKEVVEQSEEPLLLLLIGAGGMQAMSCEEELIDFVAQNKLAKNVKFLGYTENVVDYLRASDYFVIASESEALCLSLLEAMSCGLLVISTNVGGIQDYLRDGTNGRSFEINNAEQLRSIIFQELETTDHEFMEKSARDTVVSAYGISKVATDHLTYFKSLFKND